VSEVGRVQPIAAVQGWSTYANRMRRRPTSIGRSH